jgi:heptosyltransferase III
MAKSKEAGMNARPYLTGSLSGHAALTRPTPDHCSLIPVQTLVYHAGALGDFLTMLPVLRLWRQHQAGGRICLLGKRPFGELALGNGLIDEIWDLEGAENAAFFATGGLPPTNADRLKGFDAALVFAADNSPLLASLRQGGIPRIRHQPPFGTEQKHTVDYHLSLLSDLRLPPAPESPILEPQPEFAREAASLLPALPTTVLLHAGSGSLRKNWPFARFAALAGRLKREGLQTAWLHGPAEPDLPYPSGDPVLRQIRLPVLVHLLASCRFYVGNDSGISHLAAACGAAGVLLFGASDPKVWAPRGRRITIVTGHSTACAPCHPHSAADHSSCGQRCLTTLTVGKVYAACRKVMRY